jgi:hypothetical protein
MFSVDRQLLSRDFAPPPLPWSCHAQRSLWGFSAMSGTLACGATQNILQRADLQDLPRRWLAVAFIIIGCGFFDGHIPGTSHVMQNVSTE